VDERQIEMPNLDINYGAGTRIQLKFEMPSVAADGQAGATPAS
jgi:hypothetical protein